MKRSAIVTGAAGGIGLYLAKALGDRFHVVPTYHTQESADAHDGKFFADVTDAGAVGRMIEAILSDEGKIDLLVNAAGVSINGFTHKFDPSDWHRVVDINLVGSFNLAHAILPHMRSNRSGRLVFLSSVVSERPMLGTSAYAASKAGLAGLTRSIALENARLGVTCNSLGLGYFDAGMLFTIPDEQQAALLSAIPMNRFGKLEEVAESVRFLADTEYVTGQTLAVNGGLHMG